MTTVLNKKLSVAAVLAVIALASPAVQARYFFNFQTPVTPIAVETLHIHDLFLGIITILFTVSLGILLYAVFAYRKSRGCQPASFTAPTSRRQWILVILPFLGLAFIDYVVLGIPAYHSVLAMANTREGARMVVKITASQWKWRYEYPGYGIKFNSVLSTPPDEIYGNAPKDKHFLLEVNHPLVLPTGEKIRILLTSTDVIHSWWVPALGVKQDVIPGFLRATWVKIEKTGVYRGQCAELCGVGHAFMPIVVQAVTPEAFKSWVKQQQVEEIAAATESTRLFSRETLIARGQQVFAANCAMCHQANGQGIPGTFPPITAGQPFSATRQMTGALVARGFYRDGKITLGPVAQHIAIVLHGIPGTPMPAFGNQLRDADIAAVITYERNNFGNHTGEVIEPMQVQAARAQATGSGTSQGRIKR